MSAHNNNVSAGGMAAVRQPTTTMALVPRRVAAAINPLISDMHAHNTMEEVADLIEDIGVSALEESQDDTVGRSTRLLHQLAGVVATALRYEAAQALRAFPEKQSAQRTRRSPTRTM